MALAQAVDRLCSILGEHDPDVDTLQRAQQAGREVSTRIGDASPADIEEAAGALSAAIGPLRTGAQGAITLGVLIEHGASTAHIDPVLSMLTARLPEACRFLAAVTANDSMSPEAADAHPNPFFVAGMPYEPAVVKEAADREPEGGALWLDLALWSLPCIAALSRDRPRRRQAQADPALHAALDPLRREDGAGFLHQLVVSALGDEALHVLHPELQRGFVCQATDVVSVFQLHALLAAALVPLGLPGEVPNPAATACWRGLGPPSVPESSVGAFQLWHAAGLGPDGRTPQGVDARGHWVWNEDMPAVISRVDGVRTLLISTPELERTWSTGRTFGALHSDVTVQQELAAGVVRQRLDALSASTG